MTITVDKVDEALKSLTAFVLGSAPDPIDEAADKDAQDRIDALCLESAMTAVLGGGSNPLRDNAASFRMGVQFGLALSKVSA